MPVRSETLGEMPESFLLCRDMRHHWTFQTDEVTYGARKTAVEVKRWYICPNCKSELEQTLTLPDFDQKRKIHYSDGYLLAKDYLDGLGRRLNVRDVRAETLTRAGVKF